MNTLHKLLPIQPRPPPCGGLASCQPVCLPPNIFLDSDAGRSDSDSATCSALGRIQFSMRFLPQAFLILTGAAPAAAHTAGSCKELHILRTQG